MALENVSNQSQNGLVSASNDASKVETCPKKWSHNHDFPLKTEAYKYYNSPPPLKEEFPLVLQFLARFCEILLQKWNGFRHPKDAWGASNASELIPEHRYHYIKHVFAPAMI